MKRYNRHMLIATALVAIGAPYVLVINATASTGVIVLHALILWVVAPPFLAAAESVAARRRFGLFGRVFAAWAALLLAVATMVAIMAMGTRIPLRDLIVPALGAALVPVFSWYALVVLYDAWRDQREHALRLETSEAKAAWAALNARIQPHFLFNSLTSLEQLIAEDAQRATQFLQRLARLYRRMIEDADARMRPLGDELDLVRDYLHVQKVRFGERLTFELIAPEPLRLVALPAKLLLTLAENAMKHGIEALAEGGTLRIEASSTSEGATIRVTNPRAAEARMASTTYGHRDVRERLALAFGGRAAFDFTTTASEAVATLRIPR